MTIEQFYELALKHYEQGGDMIVECWDKEEMQAFLDEHGANAEQEALKLFRQLNEYSAGIRNTEF